MKVINRGKESVTTVSRVTEQCRYPTERHVSQPLFRFRYYAHSFRRQERLPTSSHLSIYHLLLSED